MRTASEVLRSLEERVSLLERSASHNKTSGFSSFECMACFKPIMVHALWEPPKNWSRDLKWLNEVVFVPVKGKPLIDMDYDGHGSISGHKMSHPLDGSIFHYSCWVKSGKPGFSGFPDNDPNQGFFWDEKKILKMKPKPKAFSPTEEQTEDMQKALEGEQLDLDIDHNDIIKATYERLEKVLGVTDYKELDTKLLQGISKKHKPTKDFYYFVYWLDNNTKEYVGGYAYGQLDNPRGVKAMVLARNEDHNNVSPLVFMQIQRKMRDFPLASKNLETIRTASEHILENLSLRLSRLEKNW